MKQIINGKKYDTDTAKEIAHYCAPGSVQDFSYSEETLYRKKTGEYFLYGKGGPASRYSRSCGQNQWEGDQRIIPFTEYEARAWAERCIDADEYEAIFGEVEE